MAATVGTSIRAFRIFLSYSGQDDAFARQLVAYLERGGHLSCFFAPRDIPEQVQWQPRLSEEIRQCDVVLFLYTQYAVQSEYVRFEISEAARFARPVWLIKETDARLDHSFARYQFTEREAFKYREGAETECFQVLETALTEEWEALNRGIINPADSPYPGFQPFGKAWADYYFGRGDDARWLAEALSKPHDTRDTTKDDRMLFVYGPSGVGKTSLLTVGLRKMLPADTWLGAPILVPDYMTGERTGYRLLHAVLQQLRGDSAAAVDPGEENIVGEICAAAAALKHTRCIFIFDQTEELFGREQQSMASHEFLNYANNLLGRCWRDRVDVRVLISFREEYWGRAELYAEQLQINPWWRAIRKLTTEQAVECIVEPAKARRVNFDPDLAAALASALAVREGRDYTVEPRKISQVCKRLWEKAGRMPGGPHSAINAGCLAEWHGTTRDRAAGFVREVLEKDLDEAIHEIAERQISLEGSANSEQEAKEEFIRLSLLEFVANHKRTRVSENFQNGVRCVGRLPGNIADEFVTRGLVRKCGDAPEYELVHDFLAETIDQKYHGKVAFELSFNQLASTLRNAKGQEVFNRETTLLADLEPALENKLYFREDEAEFLLRCALGNQRQNVQGRAISPVGWARTLAAASPGRLLEVLRNGLTQRQDLSVTLDVLGLLHNAEIRARIDRLPELWGHVVQLALEGESEVRKEACSALIAANDEASLENLFAALKDSSKRADAKGAIGLLREAVDTLQGSGAAYWPRWKKLGLGSRAGILSELIAFRLKDSFGKITYITAVTAIFTAAGAALPFIPVGYFGASLTMGERNPAAGALQGSAGGFVWGAAVSLALLLYSVIWRGGRIRRNLRDRVAVFTATVLGGIVGGILGSAMIASTFSPDILHAGGWTLSSDIPTTGPRLVQAVQTGYGLVLPVLGIFLGFGATWSLIRILSDQAEKWAGEQKAIKTPAGAWQCVKTIAGKAFSHSWRNVISMSIGAVAARFVIHPGVHVSDSLPPLWWRTAGIALVVLSGSIFCEIGFLFGVLSVRVGAAMGEYREFLRPGHQFPEPGAAAHEPTSSLPPSVPAA